MVGFLLEAFLHGVYGDQGTNDWGFLARPGRALNKDVLDGLVVLAAGVEFAAAQCLAEMDPVGAAMADAAKTGGFVDSFPQPVLISLFSDEIDGNQNSVNTHEQPKCA